MCLLSPGATTPLQVAREGHELTGAPVAPIPNNAKMYGQGLELTGNLRIPFGSSRAVACFAEDSTHFPSATQGVLNDVLL